MGESRIIVLLNFLGCVNHLGVFFFIRGIFLINKY